MRISSRVADQIKKILAEEAQTIEEENYVPAIGWLFNRRGDESDPGPTLCFFERSRVKELQPYEGTDLLIYDSMPQEMSEFLVDCELDLIDGNFNFVKDGEIVRP